MIMDDEKLLKMQLELIKHLSEILCKDKIRKLNLIACGNSIASGYSFKEIKPLIYRMEDFDKIMGENGIDVDLYSFARAGSNSDEKLLEWVCNNITINEVNDINTRDYLSSFVGCPFSNISAENLNALFHHRTENKGLADLISEKTPGVSNLMIYSGGTGSLLNNYGRDGRHKLVHGIIQDCISMEAILKYINYCNRNSSNNQVYVCGSPNILGLHFNEIMNSQIKRSSKDYPNTSYVSGVLSKTIHKKFVGFDEAVSNSKASFNPIAKFFMDNFGYYVDIHYTRTEYLRFINNILKVMIDNYFIVKALIDIDCFFYQLSCQLQKSDYFLKNNAIDYDKSHFDKLVSDKIEYWISTLSKYDCDIKLFLKKLKYLIIEKHPHDYWFLDKKVMLKCLEK